MTARCSYVSLFEWFFCERHAKLAKCQTWKTASFNRSSTTDIRYEPTPFCGFQNGVKADNTGSSVRNQVLLGHFDRFTLEESINIAKMSAETFEAPLPCTGSNFVAKVVQL
jgi:hypothetical protein